MTMERSRLWSSWTAAESDSRFRAMIGWPFEYSCAERSAAAKRRSSSSASWKRGAVIQAPASMPGSAASWRARARDRADRARSAVRRFVEDGEGLGRSDPRESRGGRVAERLACGAAPTTRPCKALR